MKSSFSAFNEKLVSSKEISSIGTVGTLRLLRGGVAKVLNFIGRALSYTSARAYGCFLLSFGIVSLFLDLGEYYFKSNPDVSLYSLILCAVIALLSVPFLMISQPICIVFQDFRLTDRIFFDFFSIKRMHRNTEHASIPPILAVFLGFIPATVGYFLSVELVFLAMVVLGVVTIAFTSPEFSMILTILFLPYFPLLPHSELLLAVMSIITFISYALKVMVGKRVFNIDVYSILIFAVMLLAFIGGFVIGDGKITDSLIFISLLIAYFPVSNVIINRRLADTVVNAMIVSAIPMTVIAIIEFIVELPTSSYSPPAYSTPGVSAFFTSPSALAAFILVSAIFTLVFALENKRSLCFIPYALVFILEIFVLGIVLEPGAWIAALFAMLAYTVIKSRRIPLDFLFLIAVIPHVLYFIPTGAIDAVYNYIGASPSFTEKLSECEGALGILRENAWFGTGVGYVESVANNFLGLGAELGIPILSLLVICIVIRFRHLSYYRLYTRNSLVSQVSDMSGAAIVALLAFGAFDYILSDVTVLYLFITLLALSSAVLRSARRENDDRLGYYGDSSSSDSSALDVSVNR